MSPKLNQPELSVPLATMITSTIEHGTLAPLLGMNLKTYFECWGKGASVHLDNVDLNFLGPLTSEWTM